jgi:hypothetical protein
MDSLRKVEEDLRSLAVEFRKKYPEVVDAADRALTTLKTMREMYVADKMRKSGFEKEDVKIPQSSDTLAPYLLACNYADANPKLLKMALDGIQLLVSYQMIPPSDVKNVLRVFAIQAAAGKQELQLKILQVLLPLANGLTAKDSSSHFMNDAVLRSFFTITLSLCETRCNVSVSTTAQATIRQLISMLMEQLVSAASSSEAKENYASSALLLVNDFVLFFQGKSGEWCRGVDVPPAAAFDLLDYTIGEYTGVFVQAPTFRAWVKNVVFPALKPMMRDVQESFKQTVLKEGVLAASVLTSRVVRLGRCFLLNFALPEFLDEIDIMITLMVHTLTSDFDLDGSISPVGRGSMTSTDDEKDAYAASEQPSSSGGMMGGASALFGGLARFQFGGNKEKQTPAIGNVALQSTYLPLKRVSNGNASDASSSHTRPSCRLLIHPAGASLEALLSFFLSDNIDRIASGRGKDVVMAAMINTIASATTVLSQALVLDVNSRALVDTVAESKVMVLVEGAMSNRAGDSFAVMRAVQDVVMSSSMISGADMLILAFCVVQVIVRHLVEFTLESAASSSSEKERDSSVGANILGVVFLDDFKVIRTHASTGVTPVVLREIASKVAESIFENIQDACTASLSHVNYPLIVRRSAGIMAEMALVTGLLRLTRPCEVIIASLCQFTVPRWHGHELVQRERGGGMGVGHIQGKDAVDVETLRWAHIQAIVRLMQTIHVLADVVSDWDVVVDAFEQITDCILSPKTVLADDVTSTEVDKVFMALERFKGYTVFLSDESLLKLMTSLIAVSLNNLAVRANLSSGGGSAERVGSIRMGESSLLPLLVKNKPRRAPAYMLESIAAGLVSFSLQAAVEVAKHNLHRISRVWQMVTSHLKMVASLKSPSVRGVAVASTHDLIASALRQFHKPGVALPEALDSLTKLRGKEESVIRGGWACLSDEALFTGVVPSFETVFLAHKCHTAVSPRPPTQPGAHGSLGPPSSPMSVFSFDLSQGDLFSSLKSLATLRHDDVKVGCMQGLLGLLQGGCELLSENGWAAVIGLIADVPLSLISDKLDEGNGDEDIEGYGQRWPIAALALAFKCMQLILDEYMEQLSLISTTSIICCLSSFSSQLLDVNISLTSLNLLWKVYDQTMRGSSSGGQVGKSSGTSQQEVFNITTKQLLVLSMDTRPEIRHCAMNTLFTALTMTANASLTSGRQWKQIFDDVVFPLFERAGARSSQAMHSHEEANAPELKKGKKIVLHHTRDTAHKQWSETRVLALRGLTRVVKTCATLLIQEKWFKTTWAAVLEVCKNATQQQQDQDKDASAELEVSLASFDVMFTMLKIVSQSQSEVAVKDFLKDQQIRDSFGAGKSIAQVHDTIEAYRRDLWSSTWRAVCAAAKYNGQCSDLALHVCQSFMSIFEESANQEFTSLGNFRDICETIVTLARPRTAPSRAEGEQPNKVAQVQLNRCVLEFLKLLPVTTVEFASLIASALGELCFANQHVHMPSPISGETIYMGPCQQKLREDVAEHFMHAFLPSCAKLSEREREANELAWGTAVTDTVFRRFINDVCGSAISCRSLSLHSNTNTATTITPQKSKAATIDDVGSDDGRVGVGVVLQETSSADTRRSNQPQSGGVRSTSKELSFFSFLTGATIVDSSSDDKDQQELEEEKSGHVAEQDEELKSPPEAAASPIPKDPTFHALKQRAVPNKDNSHSWTAFYPLTTQVQMLSVTLEQCLESCNFDSLSEPTKENIFSSVLCLLSPWRMSELPGASANRGNFVSAVNPMAPDVIAIINVIHKLAQSHPESNWYLALITTVVDATRLQILAIARSDQQQANSAEEIGSILGIWKRVADILTHAVNAKGSSSRKCAVESLLSLTKDLSYSVLDGGECKHAKPILEAGCILFLRALLQLETHLDDIPRSFDARRITETELIESWLMTMTSSPMELMRSRKAAGSEAGKKKSFDKTGHLLIFLPIAFQLHQCASEEIKDIVVLITSSVDIAALLNSYTSLLEKIDQQEV